MGHLQRLLRGADSAEEQPSALPLLLLLLYNMNLLAGTPATILKHVVSLRIKSHEMGGPWPLMTLEAMEIAHQHLLSLNLFYMRKNKLQSCLNHSLLTLVSEIRGNSFWVSPGKVFLIIKGGT